MGPWLRNKGESQVVALAADRAKIHREEIGSCDLGLFPMAPYDELVSSVYADGLR